MLRVRDLVVAYGRVTAVDGISFDVGAGEVVALIGANGAGKSSTLMAVSGIVRARRGTVEFDGAPITRAASHDIVARGLVQVPEGRMIFAGLTVQENLLIGAYGQPPDRLRENLDEVTTLFPVLADRLDEPAVNLSGGQLQLLALARGLMARPKLLLLDEPTLGLAPLAAREVLALVTTLRARGLSVLLVEQNVRQALRTVDRAYVLEAGRIALAGTPDEILADDRLISTYLGHGARQPQEASHRRSP